MNRIVACVVLLLLGAINVSRAAEKSSTEPEQYQIDACPTPFKLTVSGLPQVPPIRQETDFETCGNIERTLPFKQPDEDEFAAWKKLEDRTPLLRMVTRQGKLDLRIELRDTTPPRIYESAQISTVSAGEAALKQLSGAAGPALRVALKPLTEAYIHINVVNVDTARVAHDIVRIKNLQVKHLELIAHAKITLIFDAIAAYTALQLVAQVTELEARHDGHDAFVIGKVAHAAQIDSLRESATAQRNANDQAGLQDTLRKIVALSKPDKPGLLEAWVGEEYAELAEMRSAAGDYAGAQKLYEASQALLERLSGTKDSVDYAQGQADIARTRLDQNDRAGAKPMFNAALATIEKHEGKDSPASARILTNLASIAFDEHKLDEAAALNLRVHDILKAPDDLQWRTFRSAGMLEQHLALEALQRKDYATAQPHLERALYFEAAWLGEDSDSVDVDRQGVIQNLQRLGKTAEALPLLEQQQRLCAKRSQIDESCVRGLRDLSVMHALAGDFPAAIATWQRVIEQRSTLLGASSEQVQGARIDLALLQRLGGDDTAAAQLPHGWRRLDLPPEQVAGKKLGYRLRHELAADLASELALRLEEQLKAARSAGDIDPSRLALLEERLAEAQLSSGDSISAIEELEAAWALRLNSEGACAASTRRLAARLIQLRSNEGNPAAAQRRYAAPDDCKQ